MDIRADSTNNDKGTGIASEGGHWYYPDGRPCYTITGKNGKERSPFIKEAMALHLVPGVTTITGQVRKYGLELYMKKQTALSALTMPRLPQETDDAFVDRIIVESAEHAGLAAEKGTDCHAAVEYFIETGEAREPWKDHVVTVYNTLGQYGINLREGKPEHSFASPLGYGGKIDWHNDDTVIDFKTKATVKDVKRLAYDEHCWQLAAYGVGIEGPPRPRLINVFIGVDDCEVKIHEWTEVDARRGWRSFKCLLDFWQITKNYP